MLSSAEAVVDTSGSTQENNGETKQKIVRTQKYVVPTNIIYNGKIIDLFACHLGKSQIIGIPRQRCVNVTEMYPLDLHFMFQEIRTVMDAHRVKSYTVRFHLRDWDYSPHVHVQISLPKFLLENITKALGISILPPAPTNVKNKPDMMPSIPSTVPSAPASDDTSEYVM